MLKVVGGQARLCDGVTRREWMRVGGLTLFGGMSLPRLLQAADGSERPAGKAKSVILFNLLGGPSHQDMFDMKPAAPPEIRGEFKPIDTSLTGLQICEHLPRTARIMHHATLIRSMTHNYNAHNPLAMMTGFAGGENRQVTAEATDPPDIGAICQYLGMGRPDLPGAVCLPCYPGQHENIRRPGPYGGYLGSQFDPLFTECAPTFDRKPRVPYYDPVTPIGVPQVPSLSHSDITIDRLDRRQSLREQLDVHLRRIETVRAVERMDKFQQRAFAMLSSSRTLDAFDISREPSEVRDRYGRSITGSSLLIARRLAEAGVPFISVHAEIFGANGHSYDMHENNFGMLKDSNLPIFDAGVPTLIQELEDRRLLDSTLVVVMGEMGRSPRVNAKAGRDHWPQCGFSLLFGGGLQRGLVYGSSDNHAAYPADHPVSPADLVATIYAQLGIDPHMTVPDLSGRPVAIAHGGEPIRAIMA